MAASGRPDKGLPPASALDRGVEVECVSRTATAGEIVEPGGSPGQEPLGASQVAAGPVRHADTELCQALPEVALIVGRGLPTRFKNLVRRERPAVSHQLPRASERLDRGQRFLRHRLDTVTPIGCLLYTSAAADARSRGDLGGCRII